MSDHLSLETLARLVEETPGTDEARHLENCAQCRDELDALRTQTLELASLPDPPTPAHIWPMVRARLEAEGLAAAPREFRGGLGREWRRAAAAVLIFIGGGVAGAMATQESGPAPLPTSSATARGAGGGAEFALREAEAAYLAALTDYAESTGEARGIDPVARLATLESIVLATREGLNESPIDPVINGYHLAAISQRDALLRELGSAQGVPAGAATATDDEWF